MNITAGTYTAPGRAMNVSAPRLQQVAPSATPILSLSPNAIISIVFVACVGVGSLMAINPKAAVAALVALCYLPLVLINLPLGIALWIPTTFLTGIPGFDSASHAAGLVIAFAWFGTLRNKAREQQVAIPRKLLTRGGAPHRVARPVDDLGGEARDRRSPPSSPGRPAR